MTIAEEQSVCRGSPEQIAHCNRDDCRTLRFIGDAGIQGENVGVYFEDGSAFHAGRPTFQQKITVTRNETFRYLFWNPDRRLWQVGANTGDILGYLRNKEDATTPPEYGWEY